MNELGGRVAVVTGAASGIGHGLARAFGAAGMRLALADVEAARLDAVVDELTGAGHDAWGRVLDVSDGDAVEAFAAETYERFGAAHVVCNNAGVTAGHRAWESLDDWTWMIDVNLWGVVHGLHAFVPRMLESGEPGHIVNTGSIGGILGVPFMPSYVATKHAVVGLSQALFHQLADTPIDVSVLCPGMVSTLIAAAGRNKPGADPDAFADAQPITSSEAITPDEFAVHVVDAIRERRFWVMPHRHYAEQALENAQRRVDGGDPVLPHVPD